MARYVFPVLTVLLSGTALLAFSTALQDRRSDLHAWAVVSAATALALTLGALAVEAFIQGCRRFRAGARRDAVLYSVAGGLLTVAATPPGVIALLAAALLVRYARRLL